jgi:hypothetical protein
MWASQPFPVGNVPTWSLSIWRKLEGAEDPRWPQPTCKSQGWDPRSTRGSSTGICSAEASALVHPGAPAVRPRDSPNAGVPGATGASVACRPGAAPTAAVGPPHPRGGARRRDVRAESERGRARPPGGCPRPTSPAGAAGGGGGDRELQFAAALGRSQATARAGTRGPRASRAHSSARAWIGPQPPPRSSPGPS